MTTHANCTHPATKAARATCRKNRAAGPSAQVLELIEVLNRGYSPRPNHWVFFAASRFAQIHTDDVFAAAEAVLAYFAPSGDDAQDDRRRRNGYIITQDPYQIRLIAGRAAS